MACDCSCSCGGGAGGNSRGESSSARLSRDVAGKDKAAAEKHSGVSMMEQLVPEITTHTLSYLDHTSLCNLSMTNSAMRRAANDDNAWKALYHKVFFLYSIRMMSANAYILRLGFLVLNLMLSDGISFSCASLVQEKLRAVLGERGVASHLVVSIS